MSYDPRLGARAYGATDASSNREAKKGSVRAAWETMAQKKTQLPDTSRIIGLPRRPNQLKTEQSSLSISSGNRGDIEVDSPSPQWPLPNNTKDTINSTPVVPPRSPQRLQPPRQDIRPVSDDYPIQQLSPEFPPPMSSGYLQPPSYGGSNSNDTLSPGSFRSQRPLTTSSFASEASSLGDIPDFPVPEPPMPFVQQVRRTPILGPPPSARRGPSSYYTQMSYVSPIVEESESRSVTTRSRHGSYASSNVFPANDDFYPDDDIFSDDETITSDRGTISPTEHDDRSGLVTPSPALLRQASLGRRTKPSLMTIKSVDSFGSKKDGLNKKKAEGVGAGGVALGLSAAILAARDGVSSGRTSSESVPTLQSQRSKAGNFTGPASPSPLQQELQPSTLADRTGMRRPAKLDMDAVRDAEARGSLTSLPDLIRRATRLAANLDRGRTASRLGLDFWEAGGSEKKDVRQSGLSDMLAAFPPPGRDTPSRAGTPHSGSGPVSEWPSGVDARNGVTNLGLSNEKSKKRRRCCGMPLWAFITLLIAMLFIIAAAVVVPVVLVVVPNQNKATNTATQDTQGSTTSGSNNRSNTNAPAAPVPTADSGNGQCSGIITCQNGGVAILNSDRSCNCVCINGFTGRTCTNDDATGCTTTNIPGTAKNATMGSGIPRLIEQTAASFNVPLDATRILSVFSNMSLSCAAENALITFNGLASRSDHSHVHSHSMDVRATLHPSRTLPILHHPHPAQIPDQPAKRQTVGQSNQAAAMSDQSSAQAESIQTQPISSNVRALDFARVGVLIALQETSDLNVAANAQESIQDFLTNDRSGNAEGSTVDLGPFKLDLINFTIKFQNGTTIQASPSSSSSASS